MDSVQPLRTALLLSGGIDSTALAYLLRPRYAITVDYGQTAATAEITASRAVCEELGIGHEILRVNSSQVGAGNMLPDRRAQQVSPLAPTPEWWPFRNQLIITLAAARAVALDVRRLIIGTVKTDREHRDGLPEFVSLMDRMLRMQEGEIGLEAPAAEMESVELVRLSEIPLPILSWSHSCHRSPFSCGSCRGCVKHQCVLAELEATR